MNELALHIIRDLSAVACINGLIYTWGSPNPIVNYFALSGFILVFVGEISRLAYAYLEERE